MKKKRKLVLINPLSTKRAGLIRDKHSIYPPLALGIVAALTPDHWDIELLDENFDHFVFHEADLVGITALTSQVTRAYELAEVYRIKGIPVVMGGIHVSVMPEEASQYADAIVIGEAESIWTQVIDDFENQQLKKQYSGQLLPMLESPQPRIDLYHQGYAFGSVQTTRGCPMSCDFCSVHTFNGKKYRSRPIKDVVDEMEKIPQNNVYIVDDNFIGYSKKSAQRVVDICKEIIDRGIKKDWLCAASMNIVEYDEALHFMAEAGCKMIFLGIESELVDQLELTNKTTNIKIGTEHFNEVYQKIHDHGMAVLGAFIFGLDSDTSETMANRTQYMLHADIDAMQASILTPLPGTPLFERMKAGGRLVHNNFPEDWSRYDFVEVVFQPSEMSLDKLSAEIMQNWEKLYDDKTLNRKFLKTLKKAHNAKAALWAYNSNLQYYNMVFEGYRKLKTITDHIS